MSRFFLIPLLFLSACAARPLSSMPLRPAPDRAPSNEAESRSVLRKPLPSAQAFLGWKAVEKDAAGTLDAFSQVEKYFACETSDELTPTHPQMTIKKYYNSRYANFDVSKLRAEDEACKVPGKFKNTKGEFPCIAADTLKYVVISDTYRDACGNIYRGFSEVLYFQRDDTMGTLVSKGRSLYPRPKSTIPGDMIEGSTYPTSSSEFILFTEPETGDETQIKADRAAALKSGFEYDATTHLFRRDLN